MSYPAALAPIQQYISEKSTEIGMKIFYIYSELLLAIMLLKIGMPLTCIFAP